MINVSKKTRIRKACVFFCFLFATMMPAVVGLYVTEGAHATASTLSLTLGSNTASVNVAPFNSSGVFSKSSNVSIAASTDNATGYTLSIAASNATDYDKLKNGNGDACDNAGSNANSVSGKVSSNCFNSINAAVSEATFSGLSSTGYNGLWGYLPSKYNSVANTDFRPAPDANGDVLDVTSAANSSANNYSLAVGARVDSTMAINSYSNVYVVQLVGNAVPYAIVYDDGIVGNMPTDVAGDTANVTVAIENRTPTRDGYRFLGWCTVALPDNSAISDCATNGGTAYQPNGSITLDQVTPGNNEFHLYAVWEEVMTFDKAYAAAGKTKVDGYYTMQDAYNTTICPAVDEGQTGQLLDTRGGGTVYTVAKFKDGKCWMTENLDIAGGTAFSANDTDVTSTYISSFSTSNNLTKSGDTIVLPVSSVSGFNTNNYSYVYNSGSKTNCGASGQNTPCYSYYSWDAATLGSGRSIATDNTDAEQSICPKGWKLPSTYNGSGTAAEATDFRALMIALGGSNSIETYNVTTTPTGVTMLTTLQSSPYNFLLAGYYLNDSFHDGGSYGRYWSSTSMSSMYSARFLVFTITGGSVYSANVTYRASGLSVRCLLRE